MAHKTCSFSHLLKKKYCFIFAPRCEMLDFRCRKVGRWESGQVLYRPKISN